MILWVSRGLECGVCTFSTFHPIGDSAFANDELRFQNAWNRIKFMLISHAQRASIFCLFQVTLEATCNSKFLLKAPTFTMNGFVGQELSNKVQFALKVVCFQRTIPRLFCNSNLILCVVSTLFVQSLL